MISYALLLLMSTTLAFGQRGSFAGTKPIGFPELTNLTTTVPPDGLGNRFGEDATTQKLPLEALGDRDLVDRLSKLPIDNQPFWFINWQALEEQRKHPQVFPQRPSSFIDSNFPGGNMFQNSNVAVGNTDAANSNVQLGNRNSGVNSNNMFQNSNVAVGNTDAANSNVQLGNRNSEVNSNLQLGNKNSAQNSKLELGNRNGEVIANPQLGNKNSAQNSNLNLVNKNDGVNSNLNLSSDSYFPSRNNVPNSKFNYNINGVVPNRHVINTNKPASS